MPTLPESARTRPASILTFSAGTWSRRAPILVILTASSLHAAATAPPAMTMQREPQVPVE